MQLSEKEIEEIAENLECGMRCYYNVKTGAIRTIINFDNYIGGDEEPWEEDIKEIEDNWEDYFEFEGFESRESFRIMADFAEEVDNEKLQQKLFDALNRRKPFQNFKWEIDNSGEYRQKWFDYRRMRFIQHVKMQIDLKNQGFSEL